MKRVDLVGSYSYHETLPCEMEDLDFCSKMACISKPKSEIWFSPLKVRKVRVSWPLIISYRSIVRWKLVQNQQGEQVLFFRERRIPSPVPEIYVVQYNQKKGYFLKNISKNFSTLERFKKFYEVNTPFNMDF